jgi:hypothetical protein
MPVARNVWHPILRRSAGGTPAAADHAPCVRLAHGLPRQRHYGKWLRLEGADQLRKIELSGGRLAPNLAPNEARIRKRPLLRTKKAGLSS